MSVTLVFKTHKRASVDIYLNDIKRCLKAGVWSVVWQEKQGACLQHVPPQETFNRDMHCLTSGKDCKQKEECVSEPNERKK